MDVEVVYFDECPNWRLARQRVEAAVASSGRRDVKVRLHPVSSPAEAEAAGMHGSPTILLDGRDPFPRAGTDGWSCRLYHNETGPEGAPSVSALIEALR